MEDITYLQTLDSQLRDAVLPAYVQSFHRVNSKFLEAPMFRADADSIAVLGLISAGFSFVIAIFAPGHRLTGKTDAQVATD